ncbi:hypothetical protein K470DRAFT_215667 [Piedraia hortae CBS 480.64]|uniref:FAD-binding FR-type domain-containing protein n=1 Tax=Piedraia hortae CBS 480.64 TaxID=1314780 RepID=A0A6A7C129_9PEZI|nr:hypothetical protein K470DRAFT_215667 [Piedraia hortae CBS 480.64]
MRLFTTFRTISPQVFNRHFSSQRTTCAKRPYRAALVLIAGGLTTYTFTRPSQQADNFIPYTLTHKELVSHNLAIFTLRPSTAQQLNYPADSESKIQSIEIKQPQLQISRRYTPLPPMSGDEIRLLIRNAVNGEVSSYLHRLPLGVKVHVRGPVTEFALPQDVGKVIFIAGGTGIAPALQVVDASSDGMDVLWGCRTLDERQGAGEMVERYMKAGKNQVSFFVDQEGSIISPKDVTLRLKGRDASRGLIFVSGPDRFVEYWAGTKIWRDGRETQGPLGGCLAKMDLSGWEVVKL